VVPLEVGLLSGEIEIINEGTQTPAEIRVKEGEQALVYAAIERKHMK
jgi:hypothetical protein